MRLRVWRDAGAFVAAAAAGAGVALYVRPPLTSGTAGAALAWLVALATGIRYVAGRAWGRGILGSPEGNAAYFAAREHYALGGVHSLSIGACLGMAAMVAALLT